MEEVKPKVRIFDSAFTPFCNSASLREENKDVHPTHFEWENCGLEEPKDGEVIFVTDGNIKIYAEFIKDKFYRNYFEKREIVAWLIEPAHLRPENYQDAFDYHGCFSRVLTYDKFWYDEMNPLVGNTLSYPLGGSSIAFDRWGLYEKTKDICMFVSNRKQTEGHKLCHKIAEEFGDRIDLYGAGVGKPVDSKFEVLKNYRFCVVVESGRSDYYFTEKLIDPISVGTHPIYWGCPSIENFFDHSPGDNQKYWQFQNLEELDELLKWTKLQDCSLINFKFEQAKNYRICENYIWENYPFLFEANND